MMNAEQERVYQILRRQIDKDGLAGYSDEYLKIMAVEIAASQDTGGGEIKKAYKDGAEGCCDYSPENYGDWDQYLEKQAREYLASRSPEAERGWRKWPEERPTLWGHYLVCLANGQIEKDEWTPDEWDYYDCGGEADDIRKVIAWMPLPAPYTPSTKKGDDNDR